MAIFEAHSIWMVFSISALYFLLSTEIGFRVGLRKRDRAETLESGSTGVVTGSILGLVSFLLAFTFSIAASNYSARRGAVLDEANAIGTAYLRAELMSPEDRDALRAHLREYTEIRVAVSKPEMSVSGYFAVIVASEDLHDIMWSIVAKAARAQPDAARGLVVSALNDVIDLHSVRVAVGVRYKIPNTIWAALYLISAVALASTGYRFGASFRTRSELLPAMVIAFACIITLISDLDNPTHGFLLGDQTPMDDLLQSMKPLE